MNAPIFVRACLAPTLLVIAIACGKKESDAPVIAPAPTPAPVPTPAQVVPEEIASAEPSASASASVKPTGGGAWDPTGIKKCCAALRGNAASAPPDQQYQYNAAAAACDGMAGSQQGRQALASLRQFLLSAKMPAACQ